MSWLPMMSNEDEFDVQFTELRIINQTTTTMNNQETIKSILNKIHKEVMDTQSTMETQDDKEDYMDDVIHYLIALEDLVNENSDDIDEALDIIGEYYSN